MENKTSTNISPLSTEEKLAIFEQKANSFLDKLTMLGELITADANIGVYKARIASLAAFNSPEARKTILHLREMLQYEEGKLVVLKNIINNEPTVSGNSKGTLLNKTNA